ncbi:MAG: hypothetical protein PHR56_03245 [Dehalococcoidales bacterium]|nr:hypothetical protein [Dehalococcoidales bacterium]
MADKKALDLKTFLENVNKKPEEHQGNKVRFRWCKRKRPNKV